MVLSEKVFFSSCDDSHRRDVLGGLGDVWLLLPGQAKQLHPLQEGRPLLPVCAGGLQQTLSKWQQQVGGFDKKIQPQYEQEDSGGDIRQHNRRLRVGVKGSQAEEGGHGEH